MQKLYEQNNLGSGKESTGNKLAAQGIMTFLFEMLNQSLKEKDPSYHKKFWSEVQQKKGEAEIDFDYLEKKMPFLGAINSAIGIYESNNSDADISSFLLPQKLGSNKLEKMLKTNGKDYALSGKAAKEATKYLMAAAVIPALIPDLKELYANIRKDLNLPLASL